MCVCVCAAVTLLNLGRGETCFYEGHRYTCDLGNSREIEGCEDGYPGMGPSPGPSVAPACSLPWDIPEGVIQRLHCPTRPSGLSRNLKGQRHV